MHALRVFGGPSKWPRIVFAASMLCHAALGLYYFQFHRYNLNPDAISYISIAEKYRAGNFSDAINGYWSPMFSWLLAPFLSFSWSSVVAAKAVALAASAVLIVGARALSYRFAMTDLVRGALLAALVPVAVYMGLRNRPPDMLVAITSLFYLSLILDDGYRRTNRGWGCGALGSLCFFAKSFGLPFFLAHFVAFNALHYWRGNTSLERRQVLRNGVSGLVVFVLISGAWVAALSAKYGEFTIAPTAKFNLDLRGSGYPHNRMLLAPPNPSAVSYWEDPYLALRDLAPQAATGAGDGEHRALRGTQRPSQLSSILRKLRRSVLVLQSFSVFSIAVLIGAVWRARPWAPTSAERNRAQDVLLTLAIYCGGYSLVFIEPRYLWVCWPLVMIVGVHLASIPLAIRNVWAKAAGALLIMSFVASCWVEPWAFLEGAKEATGRNSEQPGRSLQELGVHGRIASDTEWGRTLSMAFHSGLQYYGVTGHGEKGRDVRRELEENNIDYYLVWSPEFNVDAGWKEIPSGRMRRLRIFSLKELPRTP